MRFLGKKLIHIVLGFALVLLGQAAINPLPKSVTAAAGSGSFDSHLIEEFGPNTLGKAIIRKIMDREKPKLTSRDQARGQNIFKQIQNQPVVVSISSAQFDTFSRRGLLSPFENPLSRPSLNLAKYNQQIREASGVRFPSIMDVRGEVNREMQLWNSLRPKHAYILPNELLGKSIHNGKAYQPPQQGLELWSAMENEGDVIFVLKDHVKEFSTFTFGNLLKDLPTNEIQARTFTFFERAAGEPRKLEVPWEARYIEVQIWGEVGKTDVKEVWVAASADKMVFEKAKSLGLPVFKFKRRTVDSEDRRGIVYETLDRVGLGP